GPGYGSGTYWVDHVRRPVRFADSVRLAESLGAGAFVEVGPGGALTAAVSQSLFDEQAVSVAMMGQDRPGGDAVLSGLARLYTAGALVNWVAVLAGVGAARVELPTYGFARQRFWLGDGSGESVGQTNADSGAVDRLRDLAPAEQRRRMVD